jgi:hypothetical protein
MLENLKDKHKKIQFQIGYFHVAITIKHKDANVMLNSDPIYYASGDGYCASMERGAGISYFNI